MSTSVAIPSNHQFARTISRLQLQYHLVDILKFNEIVGATIGGRDPVRRVQEISPGQQHQSINGNEAMVCRE